MTSRTPGGLRRLLEHDALRGVAIGACAAEQPWADGELAASRIMAHAHIVGKRKGWVCIRRIRDYNATTMRHEIAHLVRGTTRHDESWRREVRLLGGVVEPGYRKARTAV